MQTTQKKLIDSSPSISKGGRAERYWRNKPVKPKSSRGITSKISKNIPSTQPLDQYNIIRYYKLKGFEYGNWVSNNDRMDKLQAAAISLNDLAKVMHSANIGCDGTIGIAFGARGSSGAKAHFEPSTFMINLTKNKGDDSLAHEYGHAIDYFFGTYIDQHKNYCSLVGGRSTSRKLPDNKGGQIRFLANKIIDDIIMNGNQLSESYKNLLEIKEDSEYWRRRNEIWARFFEQYTAHVLSSLKTGNPFLTKRKYESAIYLTKADFLRVKPAMDTFITLISKTMNGKSNSVQLHPVKKRKAANK